LFPYFKDTLIFLPKDSSSFFDLKSILLNNPQIVQDLKDVFKTLLDPYFSSINEIKLLLNDAPQTPGIGIVIIQNFNNFPTHDITVDPIILSFVSPETLQSLCNTNKYFNNICNNNEFWRLRLSNDFGLSFPFYEQKNVDYV